MKKEASAALSVLTCAAMALPGMTPHRSEAATMPDKHTASYRFTSYVEGDQTEHSGSATEGPRPRYDISVHQSMFSGPIPMPGNVAYKASFGWESMSGASPWYVTSEQIGTEVVDGVEVPVYEAVQVMSGASIEESRFDMNLGLDFYKKSSKLGVGFGFSNENDYTSFSGSVNHSTYFNDKNTTFDISSGISLDTINATDSEFFPTRPQEEENKQSVTLAMGVSHVVNKELLVGGSVNYVVYNGYMSDPYKLASVEGATVADSRPDLRKQAAINMQARWFVNKTNSALHTDYRLFNTDWGTISHTLNVAWFQNFGKFQVVPRLRYYNQTAANFYRNFYLAQRADGYYSSDYRLSEYQAVSFRLKGLYNFGPVTVHGTFEDYTSFSTNDDPIRGENPGLVDFSFISFGADLRF